MLIEGYEVNTHQLDRVHWQIYVVTPDNNKFIAQVQAHGYLSPEIAYEQIWKKNLKSFTLDLESSIVYP
jgi:hypothetical protein